MVHSDTTTYNNKKLRVLLTKREKEVLYFLSRGYTDIEIGKELFLSQYTIKTHRANLIQKFNARNSCHLVFLSM
jgi:DNA-binding NarL/FixJ family response regulator